MDHTSEISNNNSTHTNYIFPQITKDLIELDTIKYLENFVLERERAKLISFDSIKRKILTKIDLSHYNLLITHKPKDDYVISSNYYKILYKKYILEHDKNNNNPYMLSLVLRLLFTTPIYINTLNDTEWNILIDKLVDIVLNENKNNIFAIKCLEIMLYLNYRDTPKEVNRLYDLAYVLTQNLGILLYSCDTDISSSVDIEFDKSDSNENQSDVKIIFLTFESLCLMLQSVDNIFHCLTLLSIIIPGLKNDDRLSCTAFIKMIVSYLDIKKTRNEIISCLSSYIILRCIEINKFIPKLFKSNSLSKCCSVNHTSTISYYIRCIFEKISLKKNIMKNLHYIPLVDIEKMISYMCDSYLYDESLSPINFLINLIKYPELLTILIKMKGMDKLYKSISTFACINSISQDRFEEMEEGKNIKIIFKKIYKLYFFYIFIQIYTNYQPSISSDNINYINNNDDDDNLSECINYLENFPLIYGITKHIPVIDEFVKDDLIILTIKVIWKFVIENNRNEIEIYKMCFNFLYILSFYNNSKGMFFKNHSLKIRQRVKDTSLIKLIKIIFESNCEYNKLNITILMNVIHNIIKSLFKSEIEYKNYISGNFGSSMKFNYFDKIGNKYMNKMLQNEILFYMLIACGYKDYFGLNKKAIFILYLFCAHERSYKLLSENIYFFQIKLPEITNNILIMDKNSENDLFIFYSLELVKRINTISKKCYRLPINDENNILYSNLTYNHDNLLDLIHDHLLRIGFNSTASALINDKFNQQVDIQNDWLSSDYDSNSLDDIIKQYVIKKHLKCTNPIAICPPISLFDAHQCPKPVYNDDNIFNLSYDVLTNNHFKYLTSVQYKMSGLKNRIYNTCFNNYLIMRPDNGNNLDLSYNQIKFLFDDNFIISDSDGITIRNCNYDKLYYLPMTIQTIYMQDSHKGNLINFTGINEENDTYFSEIFKYDSSSCTLNMVSNIDEHFSCVFSHDEKKVYGLFDYHVLDMFDIETKILINIFSNTKISSYYHYNTIETTLDDNLILTNGDLYCVRSGKLIHSFERFNHFTSGIFTPCENYILISSELWDLRTFTIVDQNYHLFNNILRRTYNDDIIYGISIQKSLMPYYIEDHDFYTSHSKPMGEFVKFYSTSNFNQLGVPINLQYEILSVDISRNTDKLIALLDSTRSTTLPSYVMTIVGQRDFNNTNLLTDSSSHNTTIENDFYVVSGNNIITEDIDSRNSFLQNYYATDDEDDTLYTDNDDSFI